MPHFITVWDQGLLNDPNHFRLAKVRVMLIMLQGRGEALQDGPSKDSHSHEIPSSL